MLQRKPRVNKLRIIKPQKLTLHENILNVNRSQPFGGTGQRSDIKGELMVVGEID